MHQRFLLFSAVSYHFNDYIGAFFNANFSTVKANIIVLRSAPNLTGIMLVIYTAAFIFFQQTCFGALFGFAIEAHDPVSAGGQIRMDVCVDAILPIF